MLFPFVLAYFDYKDEGAFPKPPSYNVATTLPSYDEAERTKAETSAPLVTGRVSVPTLFLTFSINSLSLSHTHKHTDCGLFSTLPEFAARQEVFYICCGNFFSVFHTADCVPDSLI